MGKENDNYLDVLLLKELTYVQPQYSDIMLHACDVGDELLCKVICI